MSTAEFRDHPLEPGRGTTALLTAVLARAGTLAAVSGAQAVASMVAGLAAIGRSVTGTVEGRHLREALDRGRLGANMEFLFGHLGLGALASASPPTPMLEDFFNDVALVLAPDIPDCVDAALAGAAGEPGFGPLRSPAPVDPADFVLGLLVFSTEMAATLTDLIGAGPLRTEVGGTGEEPDDPGRVLR